MSTAPVFHAPRRIRYGTARAPASCRDRCGTATGRLPGSGTWAAAVMEGHAAQSHACTEAYRAAHTAVRAGLSSGSALAGLESARRGGTSAVTGALVVADESTVLVAWSGAVRVYVLDTTGPELDQVTFDSPPRPQRTACTGPWDAVLLATSGVHQALDHGELRRTVAEHPDAEQGAAALVAVARAAEDHVAAVILTCERFA